MIITGNEWTCLLTLLWSLTLETLAQTFNIPARQRQFIQENIFNNAPIRRMAIAMNTNFAFTGSHNKNSFYYQ